MPEVPFDRTIDWNRYYADADGIDEADASPSAGYVVEPLLAFLARRDPPEAYADVGCGPGAAVFAVADRYPDATVVGYDAAEAVLAANRERAAREDRSNVRFERTVLPAFAPGRTFDVVSSCFTLCYVADVEAAIANLYEAVAPGGALVLTYHNRYARAVFESIADDPHAHLDADSAWDPDTFADRFELVLEGESLLSYERIHDVLGTWPRSLWSAVDAERYAAWRQNPLVYVPK